VERERARASGARRLLPWAVLSAVLVGSLVGFAGAGWRGGLVIGLLGLLFAGFTASAAVARCPACGAPLGRLPDAPPRSEGRPDPAEPASSRRCSRCRVRFE
jgi:hypothetical protein